MKRYDEILLARRTYEVIVLYGAQRRYYPRSSSLRGALPCSAPLNY